MLDPPQLPAGAAQWPPGVAQGAGQLPCGELCSHGPGDSEGRSGKDSDAAGLSPQHHTSYSATSMAHTSPFTSTSRTPFHIPEPPPQRHSTHLCLRPYPTQSLPRSHVWSPHSHSPQDSQHPTALSTISLTSAQSSLSPHLHVDKGPQVSPWQLQQ